jgi:hypothetical protein
MLAGVLLALVWVVIALLGGISALCFVLGMKGAGL